jgi:uncharacterized protein (DUF427 family)
MAEVPEFIRRARAAWAEPGRPRPLEIEAPSPGRESVWDYPRPPRVEPVPGAARVRVEFGGRVIADSTRALRLLETSHPPSYYLPPADVDLSCLHASPGGSTCEWKGQARYWTVVVATPAGERVAERAAWSYPDPFPEFELLRDHLCFYCAPMDACWVGDRRARPQPGGFYGGWITDDLAGPFKGGPGSSGW